MLGLKLVWKKIPGWGGAWTDYAWNKYVSIDRGLNFVAAYKEVDRSDADQEPDECPDDWDERKYWRIVYLSYDFNDEYLPQEEYTVRKLRKYIKLKTVLLGMEGAAIERLREEGKLEDWYLDAERN